MCYLRNVVLEDAVSLDGNEMPHELILLIMSFLSEKEQLATWMSSAGLLAIGNRTNVWSSLIKARRYSLGIETEPAASKTWVYLIKNKASDPSWRSRLQFVSSHLAPTRSQSPPSSPDGREPEWDWSYDIYSSPEPEYNPSIKSIKNQSKRVKGVEKSSSHCTSCHKSQRKCRCRCNGCDRKRGFCICEEHLEELERIREATPVKCDFPSHSHSREKVDDIDIDAWKEQYAKKLPKPPKKVRPPHAIQPVPVGNSAEYFQQLVRKQKSKGLCSEFSSEWGFFRSFALAAHEARK
eukprot:TRINITY_DN3780_c0_g1_i1.p1 TRINITY_DN3780_c0_g1~~TRINITY_DN3780_c0_g1_i1.p1  ORF type:complete len:294 (+),score=35.43 TRINITY_DN3780_c0_g1_i1:40-921(+)